MKVEIHSKKWIKPATPTPPHLHKHHLSAIDELQASIFVPLIFHFQINSEGDDGKATSQQRVTCLEESLSKVLTLYYPLSGRYDEEESTVCCEDQGVGFVVATVDRKLEECVDGEDDNEALVSGLEWNNGQNSGGDGAPMLFIQVNIFTCGGLAIGLNFFHKVCDTYSLCKFLHAWTVACRVGTIDQLVRPSFNLSTVLPPQDHHFPKPPPPPPSNPNVTPPKFVTKRYIFTGEALSHLKSTTGSTRTRVELTMAIVVRSLINTERAKRARLTSVLINQPMNFRNRTTLPIEDDSFGNLCIRLMSRRDVGTESLEIDDLAGIIHSTIRDTASSIRKVGNWMELSHLVEKTYVEFYEGSRKGDEVSLLRFSSWCRFPLYEVDFGWGRPSVVSIVPPPFVFVCLMDSAVDKGGVEVWVCLTEEDQTRFRQEQDILGYAFKR